MAAEAPTNSPAPVSYPVLPQYPELIFAAIEAVDAKNGANKSSISKQIEATYGSLPAAHTTLLSHHLNKMKASGQLIIVKNNYVKPDPNAPPRRGRGRPPKAKKALPEGGVASSPRPRGRPRKTEKALPEGGVVSSPRPRGRPPRAKQDLPEGIVVSSPRPRGRPPKPRDAFAPVASPTAAAPSVSGRKRGRPPKLGKPTPSDLPPPSGERRGRGRPPKVKSPSAAPAGA